MTHLLFQLISVLHFLYFYILPKADFSFYLKGMFLWRLSCTFMTQRWPNHYSEVLIKAKALVVVATVVFIVLFLFSVTMTNNHFFCAVSRFQCHVHTYRILPDADGLLAVQVKGLISF